MAKITFVTSVTTLLLFAAKTRAICTLYTPNTATGIVNEQEFEVYWQGCFAPVLVNFWDKDTNTILTDYDGSDNSVGFTIHNGVGAHVYFTLTDADGAKATSITYTVKAGLGGLTSVSSIAPLPTSSKNTIQSQPTSPTFPTLSPSTTDDIPTSLGSLTSPSVTFPSFSYPTNTAALSSVLSLLSKSYGSQPTNPGSQPTNPGSQPTNNNNNKKSSPHIGLIVGAAVGGVVALGLIAGLVFFIVSRSNKKQRDNAPLNQQPASVEDGTSGTPHMSNAPGSYGPSLNSHGNNAPGTYNPGYNNQLVANTPANNPDAPYNLYPPSHGADIQSQYTQPHSPSLTGPPQQPYGGQTNYNNVGNPPIEPSPSPRPSVPYNTAENWNSGHATHGGYNSAMSVQRPGQPFSGAPELS